MVAATLLAPLSLATGAAVTHRIPGFLPLFPPGERQPAHRAYLAGKMLFLHRQKPRCGNSVRGAAPRAVRRMKPANEPLCMARNSAASTASPRIRSTNSTRRDGSSRKRATPVTSRSYASTVTSRPPVSRSTKPRRDRTNVIHTGRPTPCPPLVNVTRSRVTALLSFTAASSIDGVAAYSGDGCSGETAA
jgi:hypothetical protein